MSIQAGKLHQHTNVSGPFGHSPYRKSSQHGVSKVLNTVGDDLISLDVSTPDIPDAMERIKRQKQEKKNEQIKRKIQMAEQMESAREKVLDSYHIKTMF